MISFEQTLKQLLENNHVVCRSYIGQGKFDQDKKWENTKDWGFMKKNLIDKMENSNMFFVPDLDCNEGEEIDLSKICTPFENCWFELTPSIFEKPEYTKDLEERFNADVVNEIMGFGMFEIMPMKYIILFCMKTTCLDKKIPIGYTKRIDFVPCDFALGNQAVEEKIGEVAGKFIVKIIKSVFSRIDRQKFNYVINDKKVIHQRGRIDGELRKVKYNPRNVIYLSSLRHLKKCYPEVAHRIISKPAYAYEVMGHWRTIDDKTIGKDRQGNRGVKGFTWVVPHVRGEGEVLKKARVLVGGEQ